MKMNLNYATTNQNYHGFNIKPGHWYGTCGDLLCATTGWECKGAVAIYYKHPQEEEWTMMWVDIETTKFNLRNVPMVDATEKLSWSEWLKEEDRVEEYSESLDTTEIEADYDRYYYDGLPKFTHKYVTVITKKELQCDMWTNNLYELEVEVYNPPVIEESVMYEDDNNILLYGESNGFVSYGSVAKKEYLGHKAGYRWSSRASVFNGMFGKKCLEVVKTINGHRYASNMTVETVLKFLPVGFYIVEYVKTNADGKISEISYYITNKEHEKTAYHLQPREYHGGERGYIRNRIMLEKLKWVHTEPEYKSIGLPKWNKNELEFIIEEGTNGGCYIVIEQHVNGFLRGIEIDCVPSVAEAMFIAENCINIKIPLYWFGEHAEDYPHVKYEYLSRNEAGYNFLSLSDEDFITLFHQMM